MSGEKGGALVRSPPGILDPYNPHVSWDPQKSQISSQKPQQSSRNATVTKLASGDLEVGRFGHGKHRDRKGVKGEDLEQACPCGGWARVRQLSHDILQLRQTHESILSGLHKQIEELKFKNRDLTFQLLMGPYASEVRLAGPQSPESDVTSPKGCFKKENKSTSTSENELEVEPVSDNNLSQFRNKEEGKPISYIMRPSHSKAVDPRLVRTLDIELLEEEAANAKKQLKEQEDKNKYLAALVDDLKRQIREEARGWHPPNSLKKGSQFDRHKTKAASPARDVAPPNLSVNNIEVNSAIRLPSIPLQQRQRDAQSEEQSKSDTKKTISALGNKCENQRKIDRSSERRARTTLPAIVPNKEKQQPEQGGASAAVFCNASTSTESSKSLPKQSRQKGKGKDHHQRNIRQLDVEQEDKGREAQQGDRVNSPQQKSKKSQASPSAKRKVSETRVQRTRSSQRGSPLQETDRNTSRESSINGKSTHASSPLRRLEPGGSSNVNSELPNSNDHGQDTQSKPSQNRSLIIKNSTVERTSHASGSCTTSDGVMASSSSSLGSVTSSSVNRPKHRGRPRKSGKGKTKKDHNESSDLKLPQ